MRKKDRQTEAICIKCFYSSSVLSILNEKNGVVYIVVYTLELNNLNISA